VGTVRVKKTRQDKRFEPGLPPGKDDARDVAAFIMSAEKVTTKNRFRSAAD
jgi:hypothetical protein